MNTTYIQIDEFSSRESQLILNEVLFTRVSKITPIIFELKPSLIPFNFKFPIIDPNEQSIFLKECMKHNLFKDLPKHYQEKVFLAEKVNFYNLKFLDYLNRKKMSENEFSNKNPKTKLDILYDFLFSNHMDVGILEL